MCDLDLAIAGGRGEFPCPARRVEPRYFATNALISSCGIGRRTGGRRLGATGDRVHDQRQRAAGLQHVVHGLRYALLVGPVEGLPKSDQSVRPGGRVG
jgi:hypothetical protein